MLAPAAWRKSILPLLPSNPLSSLQPIQSKADSPLDCQPVPPALGDLGSTQLARLRGTSTVTIHPLAAVSPDAQLARNVEVGPFCVIESGAVVGEGCRLASHVVIRSGTRLGKNNRVSEGAILGGLPQHMHMPEHPGRVEIGDHNAIRENVTIHRSLYEDGVTQIGSGCLLMVNSHVAHDCRVDDGVIVTNNVMLAGHVEVGSRAYLAGAVAVHQFCRIGRLAMVGGLARVRQDVPPFVTIDGGTTMVVGLNKVGLRRAGFSLEELAQLKEAYRLIYRSGLPWVEMLMELRRVFPTGPAAEFTAFFQTGSRGYTQERRTPPGATVRLVRDDEDEESAVEKLAG
jgi:UDP-N-acetylglucosamine acyltransferase